MGMHGVTWNLEALENLPRIDFRHIENHEGSIVALFVGNNTAHIGRLKTVAARTRGNRTMAVVKVTVLRRSGRVTRHHQTMLWPFRHGEKERGFAVISTS